MPAFNRPPQPIRRPHPTCPVGLAIAAAEAADDESGPELRWMIQDVEDYSRRAVAEAIAASDLQTRHVTASSVGRHRRGECACPPEA